MADDVSEVLFDLVSPDRLALVSELSLRKQRLTDLSKLSQHTVQECSRDLNRLSRSGLVRKDPEGLYEITSFGRAMLRLVPGLSFLVREREYFLSHELSFLPQEFGERIGELAAGKRVDHASLVLDHIREVVSKGHEHVWLISDWMMPRRPGIGSGYTSKDIPVRLIAEQSIDPRILSETKSGLLRTEIGILQDVRVAMAINESIAGICFPGLNGKIDFSAGYTGSDPTFRAWCVDLFDHYWSQSRRIQSVSEL